MPAWRIPTPPGVNRGLRPYVLGHRTVHVASNDLAKWRRQVEPLIGDWKPPERCTLSVSIVLYWTRASLYKRDIDGPEKFILDLLVGKRHDQWIVEKHTYKAECQPEQDGWCDVSIKVLGKVKRR